MQKEKQPTFVIRKLTIGAASVLVGLSFFNLNNRVVKADTINNSNAQASAVNNQNAPAQSNQSQSTNVVQTTKTNHTQINYQDQNGKTVAPSKDINTEYQGYYKTAQGQVTYHDDTTNQDIANSQVSGYVGQKPDITKSYTDKGYDVVSNNQGRLSQNSQDNSYTVHLKHHIDSQVTNSQKATNTINYVDSQNKQLQNSTVQTHNFETRTDTDCVTGQITRHSLENSYTFKGQNNPVIDGYITNSKTSQDITVTPKDLNKQENVVYQKLGEFIMIDTDNNIIGSQTYQNDIADASAVINLAPTINGYKLTSDFDKILDPTKNTTLIYQKIKQTGPDEPNKPINSDRPTNQDNPNNPDKGNSNPSNPDQPDEGGNTNPNNPDKGNSNPSNPDQPDKGGNTNPNNPDKGNSNPGNPDQPDKGNNTRPDQPSKGDNNNPDQPDKPDNPDQTKDHTAKPGDTAKPTQPDKNKQDNTKNGIVSVILNAVDEQNHILLNPDTNKPYTVEEDHKLADNENDYNFNLISSPVVPGYITDKSNDEDIVVTRKMGTYTINRVYKKLGRYIFKDKDGNTIKDPMVYANSDDPTSYNSLNDAPIIEGYQIEDDQSTAIVNPYKDTTLIYDKMPESQIILKYYDDDEDKEIGQETVTGKFNSISDAMSRMQLSAARYEDQGYVLQSSDLEYDPTFTKDSQTYTTHFTHNTKRSLKEKRYTHRTIHFIDKLTGKPMQADAVQTAEWKKYQVTDAVTGVTRSESQWQVNTDESKYQHYGDASYESFKVPFYDGWHTDESVIPTDDLPDSPDDPDANKTINVYYTQNGHFKIHMLKAKQTAVGYTTYIDSKGHTYTVRDYSKDRYELVEDTDNELNEQTVTYNSDKQGYQTVMGDIAIPGEGDTDEKADGPDSPQRKTDGEAIEKTHKLNEGLALTDLLPQSKKYVLHTEEYQGRIVPKKYFTAYKITVVKGPDGTLHAQNGDAYTTGWPYLHHSEEGSSDSGRLMSDIYAPQNLDVYYRPYAVNGHKVYKNGDVGENGAYGKITNFAVKKYNPAKYAGMDKHWATDDSPKLEWPLVATDGSWSDPDKGKDNEITSEDPNTDFTDQDNEIPLHQTADISDQGDPDDKNPNQPDDGSLDNNQNEIDASRPDYSPRGDDNDQTDLDNPDDSADQENSAETGDQIYIEGIEIPAYKVATESTKTQKVHAAVSITQANVNINQPIMFYKVLVNGQEVAKDLTEDQLQNYTVNIASPVVNNETPDQASIKLSYNDPNNQTIVVKYTHSNQNNASPDQPNNPDKGNTDNSSDSSQPNKGDTDNSSDSGRPNKSDTDNSSDSSQPNKDNNASQNKQNSKSDIPADLSKADYNIYKPITKDLTLTQDQAVPNAKDVIANNSALPKDTLYAWNAKPDTNIVHTGYAYVTVMYPDNTSDTLPVSYTVVNATKPVTIYDSQKYTPVAKHVKLTQSQPAPDAKDFIENANDLPNGTTYTWIKAPYTNIPSGYPGVADMQITYPDNSEDSLAVIYEVIADDQQKPADSETPNKGDTTNSVDPNKPSNSDSNNHVVDPKNPNKGITDSGQVIKPDQNNQNNSSIIAQGQNSQTNNQNTSDLINNPNNVRNNQNTNINSYNKSGETPSNTNIHRTYQQNSQVIHKKHAKNSKSDLTKSNSFKRGHQMMIDRISHKRASGINRINASNINAQNSLKAFNARIYAGQAVAVSDYNSADSASTDNLAQNTPASASNTSNAPVAMTMPVAQVKLTRAISRAHSNMQNNNQINSQNALPQTGRANYNLAVPAIGLAVLINIELFSLVKPRKRKQN